MKKIVQVIMLPSDKGNIGGLAKALSNNDDYLFIVNRDYDLRDNKVIHQHLYFTSNEEIKVGDWYYTKINGIVESDDNYINASSTGLFKIIATTDKSLNLPLIPQSFVEDYVKSNGGIKEVDIKGFDTGGVDYNSNKEIIFWTHGDEAKSKKQTVEEAADDYAYMNSNTQDEYTRAKLAFIAAIEWQKNQ